MTCIYFDGLGLGFGGLGRVLLLLGGGVGVYSKQQPLLLNQKIISV